MHEPGFAARVAGGIDRLGAELHQSLGVGLAAVLLSRTGGGKEKYFGRDFFRLQFAAFDFGRVVPPGSALHFDEVAHHQPLQFRHGGTLQARIRRAHGGVLAHDEQAVHFAVLHIEPVAEVRVIAGDAGQVIEAPVVLLRSVVAVPRFHQADEVAVEVRPQAGCGLVLLDVALEIVGILLEKRHRQIAGKNVIQCGNVGRTLNGRVSAEGENAAAGPSDIAQQHLQDRSRANDLHALGVLRESHSVADGSGLFRT